MAASTNVVMPGLRRVFPTVARLEGGKTFYPLTDWEREKLKRMKFLSGRQIKRRVKEWRPRIIVGIIRLEERDGEMWKDINYYIVPDHVEDFLVELATKADLYGIIRISNYTVELRLVTDPKDYNIDDKTIDRFSKSISERGRGMCDVR